MDLLNQNGYNNYNSRKEQSNGSKTVKILLVVCILLVIVILSLMFYLKSTQAPQVIVDINGVQEIAAQDTLISDNLGNEYINLKYLADKLEYKYNKGEFRKYEEDNNKCYITNDSKIVGFTVNSSKIYKTTEDSEIDYEYYILDHNILMYQDKLYVAVSDLKKALNIMYSVPAQNVVAIRTPTATTEAYSEEVKKSNYTLTKDENNIRAIAYGMLVANRDNLWGVLSNENYQEIIGNKYQTMNFDEYTMTYIVSNERNQYGIISTDGSMQVSLKYDSLKVISHEPLLYEVSKDKKYGIMKKDGTMLTEIEYDRIGYPANAGNKINYTLIIPDLDGKTGKTIVVEQDGKYGLIYLSNGKTCIEPTIADRIYEIEELGEIKYKAEVEDETYSLEEFIDGVRTETIHI